MNADKIRKWLDESDEAIQARIDPFPDRDHAAQVQSGRITLDTRRKLNAVVRAAVDVEQARPDQALDWVRRITALSEALDALLPTEASE